MGESDHGRTGTQSPSANTSGLTMAGAVGTGVAVDVRHVDAVDVAVEVLVVLVLSVLLAMGGRWRVLVNCRTRWLIAP